MDIIKKIEPLFDGKKPSDTQEMYWYFKDEYNSIDDFINAIFRRQSDMELILYNCWNVGYYDDMSIIVNDDIIITMYDIDFINWSTEWIIETIYEFINERGK